MGHVIVCGSDGLAGRVTEEVHELGHEVIALTGQRDSRLGRIAARVGVTCRSGVPTDPEDLRRCRIEDADAIALLDADDVVNLHGALAAVDLCPGVRIVLRMDRIELGRGIERLLGGGAVLSDADLAAPELVHAALYGNSAPPVKVSGRDFAVRLADRGDPDLRLALVDAEDFTHLFPDSVPRVLGLTEPDPDPPPASRWMPGRRRRLLILARDLRQAFDRRLGYMLLALLAIIVLSAVVFALFLDGVGPLDALYFTVTTVSTTGYGDINLLNAPPLLKVYGIGLLTTGGLSVAIFYALVTDAVVGVRLARALGRFPLPKGDHVVVAGLGSVGSRVLRELCERGIPCAAVERREDSVGTGLARTLRVHTEVGDAASPNVLAGLRVQRARCLMAITDDDVTNLECAIAGRALNPDLRVVVRIFDPDLAARMERALAIHISRSVSTLAAPAFVSALLGRGQVASIPAGSVGLRIGILEVGHAVDVAAALDGLDARVMKTGGEWFPEPAGELAAGSELVAIGTSAALAVLEQRIGAAQGGRPAAHSNHEPDHRR